MSSVGIGTDVIRREDLAQLVSLDHAHIAMQEARDSLLEQARIEAELILETAQVRADAMLEQAQQRFDDSTRLGYAEGMQRGLDDWHNFAVQGMVHTKLALSRMRERLALLVVQAVEQMVVLEDRSALFRRVGSLLEKMIADSTLMTIKVNSLEVDLARADFAKIAKEVGWTLPIKVVGSDSFEVGSCQCEWDYGTLDASIPKQLNAIRRAVQYALERSDFAFEVGNQALSQDAKIVVDENQESEMDNDETFIDEEMLDYVGGGRE